MQTPRPAGDPSAPDAASVAVLCGVFACSGASTIAVRPNANRPTMSESISQFLFRIVSLLLRWRKSTVHLIRTGVSGRWRVTVTAPYGRTPCKG